MSTVIAKRVVRSWRRLLGLRLRYRDSASTASRAHASDAPALQAELAKQAWVAQLQKRAPHLVQQWNLSPASEPKIPRFAPSDLFATAPSYPQAEHPSQSRAAQSAFLYRPASRERLQRHGVQVGVPVDYSPIDDEHPQVKSTSSFTQSSMLTAEQSKNENALPDAKSDGIKEGIVGVLRGPHAFKSQRVEGRQSIFSQTHGNKKRYEPKGVAGSRGQSNQRNGSPAQAPSPIARWPSQLDKTPLQQEKKVPQEKDDSSSSASLQANFSHNSKRLSPPSAVDSCRDEQLRSIQVPNSARKGVRSLRPQSPEPPPQNDGVYASAFQGIPRASNWSAESADRWPALLPDRELEQDPSAGWKEAQHSQQLAREQRGL